MPCVQCTCVVFLTIFFQLGDNRFINAAKGALEGLWKSRSKLGLVIETKLFFDSYEAYQEDQLSTESFLIQAYLQ